MNRTQCFAVLSFSLLFITPQLFAQTTQDCKQVKTELTQITKDYQQAKTEFVQLKQDFAQITKDYQQVKTDFSLLKQDFAKLMQEYQQVKTELSLLKEENEYLRKSLKINQPIQLKNMNGVEYKLIKAEGSGQSVTFTVIATNSGANKTVQGDGLKITLTDINGNKYDLDYNVTTAIGRNELNTNVPTKLTCTFKSVLSEVKIAKLFKFAFYNSSDLIEFKDIMIEWK
ncbi:MAG: hypothetical protein V4714_13010 [Bacteroidota bacterium]